MAVVLDVGRRRRAGRRLELDASCRRRASASTVSPGAARGRRDARDGERLAAGRGRATRPPRRRGTASGSTPMPTRFERWMRSKLSAMTARTPSSSVPLAAQSRDEPGAVLRAGEHDQRHAFGLVAHRRRRRSTSARRRAGGVVQPPSLPRRSGLRRRMLANVPRIITSWLPRRAPYELKSRAARRRARCRYCAAGLSVAIAPAGEMWSVVTESPSTTRHARADDVARRRRLGAQVVEERRLADVGRLGVPREQLVPVGASRRCQRSSPSQIARVLACRTARAVTVRAIVVAISSGRRPDVAQEDRLAVAVVAERLVRQVDVDRARPARRPPPAAARPGSSRAPADGCGPRSCGCPRAPRRRQVAARRRPRRSARAAGPSCRCRSCSRSRRGGSPAPRGTASARPRSR